MQNFTLILFAFLLLATSCQDDPADNNQNEKSENIQGRVVPKATPPSQTNPDGTPKRAWSILTVDLWHYYFALSVSNTPDKNIYEGYWIDFEDDFTYTKGLYNDVVATGTYNFDFDSKILEIIPQAGQDEPSEWKVMTNGEVLILIGTSKYGNNATQIKLQREREKPKKN